MGFADQLVRAIRAEHRCIRVVTAEETEALQLIAEAAITLDCALVVWSGVFGVYDGLIQGQPPVPRTENAGAGLLEMAMRTVRSIFVTLDLAGELSDPTKLRAWRELVNRCEATGSCVVMIDHLEQAPAIVDAHSTRIELPLPDEAELERVIRSTVRRINKQTPIDVAVSQSDLRALVANLRGLSRRQAEKVLLEGIVDDRRLDSQDLARVLDAKRRVLESEGVLEHVNSPTDLDSVGGMQRLKQWLNVRSKSFGPEAMELGLTPPRGMLLLGVQGAGKSLCAKAVATAWRRPLLRLDVGRLYDRYIGESERRLRAAFQQAEAMAHIVLWIDEIEKAFAGAASQSSDGGLSRRMFGSLLTWMQEHRSSVFLVATANDIEALPPELLRKGRFDEIFFVDLPGPAARRQILSIHLSKRGRDPAKFDFEPLLAASEGFSGAEIEQAVVSAMHDCLHARSDLATSHILNSLKNSPPLSITMAERMQELRAWAEGRCVPAD